MTRSSYDMDAPLAGIRRMMVGCCGLLCVAFRRSLAIQLNVRAGAPSEQSLSNVWLSSPYSQIEPAMAFQLGLPILILRERGVLAEGVLEPGVTGQYLPDFDCSDIEALGNSEWSQITNQWIGRVRAVYDNRGKVPALF